MALDGKGDNPELVRQLMSACEQGSLGTIQALLDEGIDVDATDDNENAPLHVATANGHEHVVRLLHMRGAALDKYNFQGRTPLMEAARHGHLSVVGLLLQNKADINARNNLGASAMTMAARGGHLQVCKLLIEAGVDMSPSNGIGGSTCEFTPLMAAAQHGHDAVVRLLLDRGLDVNYRTPSIGVNSLMLAAVNGHMTTAQILIERGADPNLTNVNGHTPLEIAAIRRMREVTGFLDRKTTNKPKIAPEDVKPDIIEVAKKGDIQRIIAILKEDPSQKNACSPQDGATPLMFAAMTGRLDLAQLLVEHGCDINKQDTVSGWTALMQATYHGKKSVAKFLINAGADVLIPAKNGCTAFDMASLIDDVDTELYRLLAARAVQVNQTDRKAKTWSRPSGSSSGTINLDLSEEQPKSGLKAWWNRMSNRFRNLKLSRTFGRRSIRLEPIPLGEVGNEGTLTTSSSVSGNSKFHLDPNGQSDVRKAVSADPLDTAQTNMSVTSYETIMVETRKSASLCTLSLNQPNPNLQDGNLIKVVPPFLSPPSFDSDRLKMPPISMKKAVGAMGSTNSLTRPIVPPMKLLKSHSSTQNLSTSPTSPPGSNRNSYHNPSPSSSGGASGFSTWGKSRVTSDASSSTLTAGSDTLPKSVSMQHPGKPSSYHHLSNHPAYSRYAPRSRSSSVGQSSFVRSSHTSPNSSTSDSSSLTPRKHRAKSGSSRESTSTLTPSPSPTPKPVDDSGPSSEEQSLQTKSSSAEREDELGGLLKKLSLEGYQPIFEQQEVDMEAFLTLDDSDLKELGIQHTEPRRQILTAISELKSGKGRERIHFHETMTHFQNTLSNRSSTYSTGSENYSQWNLQQEDTQQGATSAKSRSS